MQGAEGSLKSLEGQSQKLGTTFESVKGIAGTLASAFGIAFSIGAVVNFGKALVDNAGRLVDLGVKAGASLEQLQRWAFVGAQAGVSTEQFADASFKLGIALAGGSRSVKGAVDDLGLSYANLRTLSPDAQFNAVVKALEAMESPQERNRVALELFGRSFASIAPAVAAGYTEMAAKATVSSAAQILALDRASDALDRFIANQKAKLTTWLGNAVLAQEQLSKLTDEQLKQYHAFTTAADFTGANKFLMDLANQVEIVLPKQIDLTAQTKDYTVELAKATAEVKALSAADREGIAAAQALGRSVEEISNDFGISAGALKVLTERTKSQTDADKAAITELDNLVASYEKLHVLTLNNDRKNQAETMKLQVEQMAIVNAQVMANFDAQTRLNKAVGLDASGAAIQQVTALDTLAKSLTAIHQLKEAGISQRAQEIEAENAFVQANVAAAKAIDEEFAAIRQANAEHAKMPAAIQPAIQSIIDIGTAINFTLAQASAWNALMAQGLNTGGSGQQSAFGPGAAVANNASTFSWVSQTLQSARNSGDLKGFASGGPVMRDGPIYAHAGEYVVPKGGGGGTVIINNYINGSIKDLARPLMEEITRSLKQGRQWPS